MLCIKWHYCVEYYTCNITEMWKCLGYWYVLHALTYFAKVAIILKYCQILLHKYIYAMDQRCLCNINKMELTRSVGKHSSIGGHKNLTGLICMAKIWFPLRSYKICGGMAPEFLCLWNWLHMQSLVGTALLCQNNFGSLKA